MNKPSNFERRDKQQIYDNKEAIAKLNIECDVLKHDLKYFKKEVKEDISNSHKLAVLEIKQLMNENFKRFYATTNKIIIGFILTIVTAIISMLINK